MTWLRLGYEILITIVLELRFIVVVMPMLRETDCVVEETMWCILRLCEVRTREGCGIKNGKNIREHCEACGSA